MQFATAAGDESEVRVDADGARSWSPPNPPIRTSRLAKARSTSATVEALVTAALAHTDGTVIDIEIDSDTASPYDVTVLTADRKTVDIALDSRLHAC